MSKADEIYGAVIESIILNGKWNFGSPVRPKWVDGSPAYAKSLLNVQMKYDNSEPNVLTQKKTPQKDPIQELFWIWKHKSNDVKFLREELGCTVWDEWEKEDGTIGKAYGWQLAEKKRDVKMTRELYNMFQSGEISRLYFSEKPNEDGSDGLNTDYVRLDQVDYLIYMPKTDPHSSRIKTTLWCVEDLDDMALPPCVYETHWQMWDGKLNLTVNVRNNDMGLGNPYNIYQYSVLHRLIAQVTGHEVGEICFNLDNAHIYERHMETLTEQIEAPMHDAPTLWINPDITSFYAFTIDDIKLIDYTSEKSRRMEVAI
jgi:thymidylate synthase